MPLDSSFISNITYVQASNQLIVSMTSGTYLYTNVPDMTVAMFIISPSKGQFFNRYIKNEFPATKIA